MDVVLVGPSPISPATSKPLCASPRSSSSSMAPGMRLACVLTSFACCALAVQRDSGARVVKEGESAPRSGTQSAVEGGSNLRPQRSSGSIFDDPSEDDGGSTAAWRAANEGILRDVRAHLDRRKTNADADLIRSSRGPVLKAIFGLRDFLRSEALGNVFRSLGLFLAAWLWYVFNTNTYTPPDYDD